MLCASSAFLQLLASGRNTSIYCLARFTHFGYFSYLDSTGRKEPMRIIAIMNQKGGAGKTTTAVNVAAAMGELEKRVLVLDLDPQHSATDWLIGRNGDRGEDRGLYDCLVNNETITSHMYKTNVAGVELVPATDWLLGVDKALAAEAGAEAILKETLEELPKDRWDFVLLDCPPSLGFLSVSALVAADEVLVPVEAEYMALAGLASLLRSVERVQRRLNPQLSLSSVLVCKVDGRKNLAKDVMSALSSRFEGILLSAVVRDTVRLAEAPSFGEPITTYAPKSAGAEDYRAVAQELLARYETTGGA
jgi:chromosome partitioning protein